MLSVPHAKQLCGENSKRGMASAACATTGETAAVAASWAPRAARARTSPRARPLGAGTGTAVPFRCRSDVKVADLPRLGLDEASVEQVARAAELHDVGKIAVPDAILHKAGELEPEEWQFMRQHPIVGENIVAPLHSGSELLPIIRHHHESFDGTGYPDGLAGSGIPRLARIVSVCDAYDALINDRPYRRRLPVDDALRTLADGAGIQWDPEVVETFVRDSPATNSRGVA